jgi:hypothetical protein
VLLERKKKKTIRKMDMEKGGATRNIRTIYENEDRQYVSPTEFIYFYLITTLVSWKRIFAKALIRPFAMLAREPIIQVIALYMAFTYGLFYSALTLQKKKKKNFDQTVVVFLTTMPFIFGGVYGQRPGIAGLHYLALGVGLTGVAQINARLLDPIYVYLKEKNGGVGRPEFRLREFFFFFSSTAFDVL